MADSADFIHQHGLAPLARDLVQNTREALNQNKAIPSYTDDSTTAALHNDTDSRLLNYLHSFGTTRHAFMIPVSKSSLLVLLSIA
jgi:hypothetical protein